MKILVEEELLSTIQATLEANRIALENVRKMPTGNDPFSLQEAADYLRVSKNTLYTYINANKIITSECGKRVWITRNELDAFITRHRHKVQR